MVLRTIRSVLDQDWPAAALVVVVSDDGHDPALRQALQGWPVRYVVPPERDAPGRDGAAKAGWKFSTWFNERHGKIAWISLGFVMFTDIYVRGVSMGWWTDLNSWGESFANVVG